VSSHSIGHDIFEHPRVGFVRVSTVAFDSPQSYDIAAAPDACYEAETIVFVGPHTQARVGGLIRYSDVDRARSAHVGVLFRAKRGADQ
jgi:hypothetical protein